MQILITITAGASTGPFKIYGNLNNFATPIVSGLTRAQLTAGYTLTVPDGTTIVRVMSYGTCFKEIDLTISGPIITTTTSSTTSTTTTIAPTTGNITIAYNTFSVAFTMSSSVPVPQSVFVSAGISVTGYLYNSCGPTEGIAGKSLSGNLLGLTVGSTTSSKAPTGSSGSWGMATPYRFDTLTIPLSINGGPTTSYANGATVTISGIIFTINISKTCVS